jgi:excisionase family DNA binding protein
MWQRFTERARKAVFYAQEEAGKWNQNLVGPEHLLLGLVREDDSFTARILDRIGVSRDQIRSEVQKHLSPGTDDQGKDLSLTPRAKQVVDLAYAEAKRLKNPYIGGEHLLLGLIAEQEGLAARVLIGLGMTLETTREQVRKSQEDGARSDELPKPRPGFESVAAKINVMMGANDDKRIKEISEQEELLTLDEAVKFLGTSKPTLYRLLGLDEIKGLKVGRQWRFRKADLVAYMERGPVAFTAAPTEDLDRELAFFAQQLSEPEADGIADAETKTIRLAHKIIQLALMAKASDIHLEPTPDNLLLRYRVDGAMQETRRLPSRMKESLTAQFKIMADMDVSEKRLPQDGRIPVQNEGKDFDFHVSVVPSVHGEAITMRIQNRTAILVGLDKLGLAPEDEQQMRDLIHLPNGIVLATGPTGSGKTTLLYSCLREVADAQRKTMTIEDPVEHVLAHTTQTQVNKKAGLTFAALLRAFLRQDPDIVLVGETGDLEVAQLVVEAALNGHLLLTSLHTNDAPSALHRLLDIGVEPCLISATVRGVVSTRLLRRVCENCKQPQDLSGEPTLSYIAALAAEGGYEVPDDTVFVRGAGCDQCRGRGYRGRMGLHEVLLLTEPLTEAILRRASAEELRDIAIENGMRTLLADGIRKAVEGQTTIEEVLRVVSVTV